MHHVVIGANFGDEGKGLMTDYLCARAEKPLVVRFNGGAQAGHTVTTPDARHVFHHLGSGTIAGADTFLSEFFISNPLLFFREWDELVEKRIIDVENGRYPSIYVDSRSLVTTPYEMLINQIVETRRAGGRHGSCGIGINETIERNLRDRPLRVADLSDPKLVDRLVTIRDEWLPQRLREMGVFSLTEAEQQHVGSDALLENTVRDFHDYVRYTYPANLQMFSDREIIFEGAQGLLLDEFHRWFPHVTRSRTGLPNVTTLAGQLRSPKLRVHYMTRAYMTRHGAGPFPTEVGHQPYAGIRDETNIHNEWQGSLRFGHLDVDLLHTTIMNDLRGCNLDIDPQIVMTCIDQVDPSVTYQYRGETRRESVSAMIKKAIGLLDGGMISRGPTRSTLESVCEYAS